MMSFPFALVGLLWGATNPLIRRGVLVVQARQQQRWTGLAALDTLLNHLSTPAFIAPQLLNLSGSLLFAWSLGAGSVSLAVPLANGVSLASNAAVDHLLGDRFALGPGLLGLALVFAGATLCTLSTAAAA